MFFERFCGTCLDRTALDSNTDAIIPIPSLTQDDRTCFGIVLRPPFYRTQSHGLQSKNLFPHTCPALPPSTSRIQNWPVTTANHALKQYNPTQARYKTPWKKAGAPAKRCWSCVLGERGEESVAARMVAARIRHALRMRMVWRAGVFGGWAWAAMVGD